MMKLISSLLVLVSIIVSVQSACYSQPSYGVPNMYPINNGTTSQKLIGTATNGLAYWVTVPHDGGNTTSGFHLIHVWGTPYEMGFAQGTLLASTAKEEMELVWSYLESQVTQFLGDLPVWLQDMIADFGLDAALDLTYDATVDYTPTYFYEELQGIADAANISFNTLVRVHMIAGLTQGACSAFGLWGPALDPNYKLLQLRALDWNMDGPFKNYPLMTVYHPNEGNGNPHFIVSYQAFIGGLSGASANLGISEIGVGYPDSTFGSMSRIGIPFIFILRDIIQWDNTLDDATNRMINSPRTCDLILGVGDGNLGQFRGYQYSASVLNVQNDINMRPDNATWHPKMEGAVYWGMDWDCPAYNYVLGNQIKKYYGTITPEIAIRYITSIEKSGDNQAVYYDLPNSQVYISYAKQVFFDGPENGYDRQFTQFNLNQLFSVQAPPNSTTTIKSVISQN